MYYLYVLIVTLLIPIEFIRQLIKINSNSAYRTRLKQTFGFLPIWVNNKPVIWVHAVSVGEVQASVPLISHLMNTYQEYQILISTVTVTGAQSVSSINMNGLVHRYLPADHPLIINRFMQHAKPSVLIVIETEIWPVLYDKCNHLNVPVIMLNARMSDKSFKRYQMLAGLTKTTLNKVTKIVAQSSYDAGKFKTFVSDSKKITVMKNLKFDAAASMVGDVLNENISDLINKRPVVLAASTHADEELKLLSVFARIDKNLGDNFYIIVPRHPERAEEIYAMAVNLGFNPTLFTQGKSRSQDCNLLIVDAIGELIHLYAQVDVVFMGGTLVPVGGHNMLEPAMASRAIIVGPYIDNFREVYRLLNESNAITTVTDQGDLYEVIAGLLKNTNARCEMGARAKQVVLENQGGVDDIKMLLDSCIKAAIQ